jgi:hypothetical protein
MNDASAGSASERWLRFDALLVLVGITSGLIGNYDSPVGQVSKIVPATYAFAIWIPIYVSGIYFAWRLLRRPNLDSLLGVNLLAVSFFMSGLWVRVQSNNSLELFVVGINLVVVLMQGHVLSKTPATNRKDFLALSFPSGALAGWLTLATAVTFSDGLKISFKADDSVSVFTAFAVGFAVCASQWIVPSLTFRVTLIWGLVGIVISQYRQASHVAIVAAVGVFVLLGLIVQMRTRDFQVSTAV